jgi:hypothetical protein
MDSNPWLHTYGLSSPDIGGCAHCDQTQDTWMAEREGFRSVVSQYQPCFS